MGVKGKKCSSCKQYKELDLFPKDKRRRLGVKSECKVCHSERNRRIYHENKERYRAVQKEYERTNKKYRKAKRKRRRTREKTLHLSWGIAEEQELLDLFGNNCPLTGSFDIHYDHFIALSTGHGGTYMGNIVPLDSKLNESKHAQNPFEWIKTRDDIPIDNFNRLVDKLAELNGLTSDEFRSFVYWCYENKRTVDEIKRDSRKSVDIWRSDIDNVAS